jgi:hypothetical protein
MKYLIAFVILIVLFLSDSVYTFFNDLYYGNTSLNTVKCYNGGKLVYNGYSNDAVTNASGTTNGLELKNRDGEKVRIHGTATCVVTSTK